MYQFLSDVINGPVGVCTFLSGALIGIYQFLVPPRKRPAHHQYLSALLYWAANAPWIDSLRRGVRWVLSILAAIYGSPFPNPALGLRSYLTMLAWRISAWIASIYMFVVIPVGLGINMLIKVGPHLYGEEIGVEAFILIAATCCLFLHLRFLKSILQEAPPTRDAVSFFDFAQGTVFILLGVIAEIGLIVTVGEAYLLDKPAQTIGAIIAILPFLVLFAFVLIRAVLQFGFYAPVAVALQCTLAACLALPLLLELAALLAFSESPARAIHFWGLKATLLLAALCACIVCFIVSTVRKRASSRSRIVSLCCTILVGAVFWRFAPVAPSLGLPVVTPAFTGLFSLSLTYAVPYIVIFYGIVFTNSVPDWISGALNRWILSRSVESSSAAKFFAWLFADLFAALSGLFLSAILMIAALLIAALATKVGVSLWIDGPNSGASKQMILYARAAAAIPFVAYDTLRNGPVVAWDDMTAARVGVLPAVALAMATPAVLPTVFNAIALILHIIARVAALVFVPPLQFLHRLLLIPEGASAEDMAYSYFCSTAIMGTASGGAIVILSLIIDRIGRIIGS